MGESSIELFRNTVEGPVAHLNCYAGHPLIRYFRAGVSRTELADSSLVSATAAA